MEIRKGVLRGFRGSWGSGIATLLIEDSRTGAVESVPCENAPTARALNAAFGNCIGDGHTVDDAGFVGNTVYWQYDSMGMMLAGFVPECEAPEEVVDAYEQQQESTSSSCQSTQL